MSLPITDGRYGNGMEKTFASNLLCSGSEDSLFDCVGVKISSTANIQCLTQEAAGVHCEGVYYTGVVCK